MTVLCKICGKEFLKDAYIIRLEPNFPTTKEGADKPMICFDCIRKLKENR